MNDLTDKVGYRAFIVSKAIMIQVTWTPVHSRQNVQTKISKYYKRHKILITNLLFDPIPLAIYSLSPYSSLLSHWLGGNPSL
jgi:hypothetical protein